MTEPKQEPPLFSPEEYVQRVETFLTEARGWCERHGLAVERGVVKLREERMAEYDAPTLAISTDGMPVAKILPVGSKIIGAQGRIDLVGRVTRHAFLFYVGKGPVISEQSVVAGKATRSSSMPMHSGVDGDGWYWIEATVRRAKRVEETLFLDLLTDVSDYEF